MHRKNLILQKQGKQNQVPQSRKVKQDKVDSSPIYGNFLHKEFLSKNGSTTMSSLGHNFLSNTCSTSFEFHLQTKQSFLFILFPFNIFFLLPRRLGKNEKTSKTSTVHFFPENHSVSMKTEFNYKAIRCTTIVNTHLN